MPEQTVTGGDIVGREDFVRQARAIGLPHARPVRSAVPFAPGSD